MSYSLLDRFKNRLWRTYNVLALVRLVGIALDGLYATILAFNLVLVDALLMEVLPLLAIKIASCALLGPCRLQQSVVVQPKLKNCIPPCPPS